MDVRVCTAISERRLLMFTYRGTLRVVEPHLFGRTTAGNPALSAWMRPGWSRTDPDGGWRLFRWDEVGSLSILPESFAGPRPDYNPDDPHFEAVFCHIPHAAAAAPASPVAPAPIG